MRERERDREIVEREREQWQGEGEERKEWNPAGSRESAVGAAEGRREGRAAARCKTKDLTVKRARKDMRAVPCRHHNVMSDRLKIQIKAERESAPTARRCHRQTCEINVSASKCKRKGTAATKQTRFRC